MKLQSPLTPAYCHALNAVDLRLHGVIHGQRANQKEKRFIGLSDDDFQDIFNATQQLDPNRGDVLAIEPTGFASFVEPPTIKSILGTDFADAAAIHNFLESGRHTFSLNNLAYVAAYSLLRNIRVSTAEISDKDWEPFMAILPELAETAAARKEIKLYYRNSKMLARLGTIAMGMVAEKNNLCEKPVLLFASGAAHTPRLRQRLEKAGIAVTTNELGNLEIAGN